jgi:hypothetical protein
MLASTTHVLIGLAAPAMPEIRSVAIATAANADTAPTSRRIERRQSSPIRLPTKIVIGTLIV